VPGSFRFVSSAGVVSAVSEVKSSAAWMRDAKPAAAVGCDGLNPVLDKFEGDETSDEAPEDGLAGTSLVAEGCSGIVATLPCLECPPRERGRVGVSIFDMLSLSVAVGAGPSDGTGPKFARGLARDGVLLFLVDENEASLTGDAGRCCAYTGPDADGVPSRGKGALDAVERTEPALGAVVVGRAVG
jgi:hypothetical protein